MKTQVTEWENYLQKMYLIKDLYPKISTALTTQ